MNLCWSQPAPPDFDHTSLGNQPLSTLADFLRAFEENTGWPLRFVPGRQLIEDPEVVWAAPLGSSADSVGELRLSLGGSPVFARGRVDLEVAAALANSYATLLDDLLHTRRELEQREAELLERNHASSVTAEVRNSLSKFQKKLQRAAAAVQGDSAVVCLLDDASAELLLHAQWGFSDGKSCPSRRPLRNSVADLEAMAGYAVALEKHCEMAPWNVPVDCQSALCLPVSTATQVLGTLWVFGNAPQAFSDSQVNQVEIIAGQIAAEVERDQRLKAFARETADALCR